MKLALNLIREDGGTQSRAELRQETISAYAEVLRTGSLPPVVVYYDGKDYWLADGFHRVAAAEEARLCEIDADVVQGTLRDAVFYSFGANASHGLPRSIADKRRAVERMLADPEWSTWSDRKIAEACCVSHTFIATVRRPKPPAATDSGIRSHGGNAATPAPASTPAPARPVTIPAAPPPPPSAVTPRAVDEDLRRAGQLEERLVSLTNDICEAAPRVRHYMGAELDRSLQRLQRARAGSAA